MRAKLTLDDLRWLRSAITQLDADPADLARVGDWLDMCVDVREAQQTKSTTATHDDLMHAYWDAVRRWEASCEKETNRFPAEEAEYQVNHPKPQLKAFMKAHRKPQEVNVCPLCGSPLGEEAAA